MVMLGMLTLGHAFYRATLTNFARGSAMQVSEMRTGDTIPELSITIVAPSAGSARSLDDLAVPCRIIVAFEASCPYSVEAARSEAARKEGELTLPTLWVTEGSGAAVEELRSLLRASSIMAHDPTVLRALRIQAVPAALLIGSSGEVLKTWRYRGDESHDELRLACGEPLRPE
jgi:hypothetical protein